MLDASLMFRPHHHKRNDTARVSIPAPRRTQLLDCAPAQIGPCARCRENCCRYGIGARTLCDSCWEAVEANRRQPTAS